VLDLGCGTGTLTILAKQICPGSELVGLDIDPAVLHIARRKAARAGIEIALHLGQADRLPYRSQSFDLVISSLMLHHLATAQKERAFHEVYRVLVPGGSMHVVDFGPPHTRLARIIASGARHLEQTADTIAGRLPEMMRRAGFAVEEPVPFMTAVGVLAFYTGRK
jgi:ubiquinone/menaquinone biosynthesis C-methylase UbiE